MLDRISARFSDALIRRGIVPPEEREIYLYGFAITLSSIANLCAILAVAVLFGTPWDAAAYLLAFIPIRIFSGGYHASSYFRCLIVTASVFACIEALSRTTPERYQPPLSLLLAALSFMTVWLAAPVVNPANPLSEERRAFNKKMARILLLSTVLVIAAGVCFAPSAGYLAALSLFAAAALIWVQKGLDIKKGGNKAC
ncbi:MAG: accessory gene regulator B family protein [Provencibacterium sp.]|jgi:accessory gene regulator B|nr:accessory gene regulator B family protein [Provencibacterium sp.]